MHVTIGANCWNGARRKTLFDVVKVEGLPVVENKPNFWDKLKEGSKRLNDPKVKAILGYGVPLMLLASGLSHMILPLSVAHTAVQTFIPGGEAVAAFAMPGAIKDQIMHSFDPLIKLIQSLAYPIAGVMIAGGCLFIMVGNREAGMKMLQNAAIGYILVQLSPLLLNLLVGIGAGM